MTFSRTKLAAALALGVTLAAAAAPASAFPNNGHVYGQPSGNGHYNRAAYTPRYGLRSCRRLMRLAFDHGSAWAKRQYYRHCVPTYTNGNGFIAHARTCRRLYHLAYDRGSPWAQRKFRRICRRYAPQVSYRLCRRWKMMARHDHDFRARRLFHANCRFGG